VQTPAHQKQTGLLAQCVHDVKVEQFSASNGLEENNAIVSNPKTHKSLAQKSQTTVITKASGKISLNTNEEQGFELEGRLAKVGLRLTQKAKNERLG
jgi:hypothetical protein